MESGSFNSMCSKSRLRRDDPYKILLCAKAIKVRRFFEDLLCERSQHNRAKPYL